MEFSKQEKIHEIGDAIYPTDMKEKINLVLVDICGRLPYGVIAKNCKNKFDVPANLLPDVIGIKMLIAEYDLKPYLRPMSSMTEEEQQQLKKLICEHLNSGYSEDEWSAWLLYDKTGIKNGIGGETFYFYEMPFIYDWLNSHHFDYRGLIEEELALEAPENMYKVN